MEKAIFSIKGFKFDEIQMNLHNVPDSMKIDIKPSGVFNPNSGDYELSFEFEAISDDDVKIIRIYCRAMFTFNELRNIEDIPQYFYSNSIVSP